MSVNYHAFQNRGFLFSNSEAVAEQWRSAFSDYDPSRIAEILHLKSEDNYLYLSYFQTPYRLRLTDGFLEKKTEANSKAPEEKAGLWTEDLYFNEAMSIYHLLHYTKDQPLLSNIWVPNTELDGAATRSRAVQDPLLDPFARRFTGKTEDLETACRKLGGQKLSRGDVSYQFEAFPQIQLQLMFWDADEDFPAQTQVLVDRRITDFVHFETVGCIISDLLEKLES